MVFFISKRVLFLPLFHTIVNNIPAILILGPEPLAYHASALPPLKGNPNDFLGRA